MEEEYGNARVFGRRRIHMKVAEGWIGVNEEMSAMFTLIHVLASKYTPVPCIIKGSRT